MPAADKAGRLAGWLYSAYAWSLMAVLLPLFGGLAIALRRPALARPVARAGVRLLFRLAAIPVTVRGLERLPAAPHILLVNHSSFLDGLALTALLPPRPGYGFVVRQQFRVQRLLCPLLRALGAVVLTPAGTGSHAGNAAQRGEIDDLAALIPHIGKDGLHCAERAVGADFHQFRHLGMRTFFDGLEHRIGTGRRRVDEDID